VKNKITTFFITFTVIISVIGISLFVNYLRDPLQLFSKSFNDKKLVYGARHQIISIIRLYPFDSIILGTSVLENTSANESSNKLGGKFVNLSLSGGDFHTRSLVLEYALKNKKIKKVIYSLDNDSLIDESISNTENFDFLYDDSKANDIEIYLNKKYIKCLITDSCYMENIDIDRPFSWYKDKANSKRFGGLDNWFKAKNSGQINKAFKEILKSTKNIKLGKTNIEKHYEQKLLSSQKYINDTLIKHISKYKNTNFILILPPYSRIKYAIEAQYNISKFERYKANTKYLVKQSELYSNLKIYGWGNHPFVDNIANYKDLHHYGHQINSWMLGAIKRDEGLLTIENIDSYLEIFTQKSLDYNLLDINNKINIYLNSK
jgi:hypothetical protein